MWNEWTFSPCHWKSKITTHLKLYTQMPTLNIFEPRRRFRKSVEYIWRDGILLEQRKGWKWQNFKCWRCAKFSPFHCKSKIPGFLKLSTEMPTLNIFDLRQRFRKSFEYLCRYRILGGTFYRLKVENFKCCRCTKFSPCHFKSKYLGTWNFPPKCPPSTSSSWIKDFENRLNTFRDIGFCLHCVQVESGKISNVVEAQNFYLAIGKVKCLRNWNLTHKCPP